MENNETKKEELVMPVKISRQRYNYSENLSISPYIRGRGRYLFVLAVGFFTALAVMLPFIIYDKGYFLQYGDFNVQQYPFYMHTHDAIQNGEWGWDHKTDLGANFIGSYSFYNLGSPFFLITLLFPSAAVPYMIGPLLALKIGFCAMTGYAYIRRFTRIDDFAVLGGMMYAMSGFSIFNMFFNHFHEPMVFFPLMLIALEEFMVNDRKGWFAVTVAINAFVNYYFFVAEAVFIAIYFFVRLARCRDWRITPKKFFTLAFETLLGFAMAGIIVLPSVWEVAQNPRTESKLYGWNALLYSKTQRYMNILESFFFPPDLPARPNFTPDSDSKWGSIAAYLPLFGMTGVIAWLKSRKGHWLRRMIIICFFMAFIPILNASFQLFSATYYARWFFMFTLMNALATTLALSSKVDWMGALKWSAGITAAISLSIGLMPKTLPNEDSGTKLELGLMEYPDRFWLYVAIAVLALALTAMIILKNKEWGVKRIFAVSLAGIIGLYFVTSVAFIGIGKTLSYDSREYVIPNALSRAEGIDIEGLHDGKYRVDFHKDMDNIGMFWDTSCIQAFHSIVPSSVIEFYESVGIQRGVASRPNTNHYAIRSLLSVKYLFENSEDAEFSEKNDDGTSSTVMPGWSYLKSEAGYNIWQNDAYIPYGFTYDYYITQDEYETNFTKQEHGNLMLRAIVLSDEQAEKYGEILQNLPENKRYFTENTYLQDAADRSKVCCEGFETNPKGFTAEITLDEPELVFFSIPYHEGWTAYVNGSMVDAERVNVGFMAVRCEKGRLEIRFEYKTPMLNVGAVTTAVSLVIFGAYALLFAYNVTSGKNKRLCGFVGKARSFCGLIRKKGDDKEETNDTVRREDDQCIKNI